MFAKFEHQARQRASSVAEETARAREAAILTVKEIISGFNDPNEGESRIRGVLGTLPPSVQRELMPDLRRMEIGESEVVHLGADDCFGVKLYAKGGIGYLKVALTLQNERLVYSFIFHRSGDIHAPRFAPELTYAQYHTGEYLEIGRELAVTDAKKMHPDDRWGEGGDMVMLLRRYQSYGDVPYLFWPLQIASAESVVETVGSDGVERMKSGLEFKIEEYYR